MLVITYLFLGGAGAGTLLILFILDFCTPLASRARLATQKNSFSELSQAANENRSSIRQLITSELSSPSDDRKPEHHIYRPQNAFYSFFSPGYQIATATLVLSSLCLILDLGHPDRILNLYFRPTLSYLSIGTYALTISIICGAFLASIWTFPQARFSHIVVRIVQGLGILGSIILIGYTGLLLYSMGTSTLLDSILVPLLFVLSAISCGIALLFLIAGLSGTTRIFSSTFDRLIKLDTVLLSLELIALAAFVIWAMLISNSMSDASILLQGNDTPVLLVLLVCCGLLFPLILESIRRLRFENTVIPIAFAVLVGGFVLRWWFVQIGFPDFVAGVM